MHSQLSPLARLGMAVLIGAAASTGHAAVYCATNVSELQAALTAAANSPTDDEIKIQQGIYAPSQQLLYNSPNPGWVFLTGGWVQNGATNCAQQVGTAASTLLTGSGVTKVLGMFFNPPGSVPFGPRYGVQNLSIRDGFGNPATFQRGGGLQMFSGADIQVEFWLDNVIVANNSGYFGGGADLYVRRGLIRVVNSLFADNSAPTTAFGHFSAISLAGDGPNGVLIANSTFANGSCPGSGGRGCGIGVTVGGGMRLDLVNTLFFNNAVSDVNIEGATAGGFGNGVAFADYSRIGTASGTIPLSQTNPLTGDPRFVDSANQDFRLRDDSPFLNLGLGTIPIYGFLGYDLGGSLRTRFGALDPGAWENQTWDIIFANGFQ
ncbi:MAG: hypothetical protein KDI81_01195 [Xanthomonadales bacterium]|nr:hypothetical protein [Xanthomonadales bacterium]